MSGEQSFMVAWVKLTGAHVQCTQGQKEKVNAGDIIAFSPCTHEKRYFKDLQKSRQRLAFLLTALLQGTAVSDQNAHLKSLATYSANPAPLTY